jgi:hypothetical protein
LTGPWRYPAVAVLSVAAVVSATGSSTQEVRAASLRSGTRAPRSVVEDVGGGCTPTLLYQDTSGLLELDPATGQTTPKDPWTNPTPLDLKHVTVKFKSSNRAEGRVRGRPIVFTSEDWFVPRTVLVAGVPDGIADGTQEYTVTAASVRSDDPAYDGRLTATLTIVNLDQDSRPSGRVLAERRRHR